MYQKLLLYNINNYYIYLVVAVGGLIIWKSVSASLTASNTGCL